MFSPLLSLSALLSSSSSAVFSCVFIESFPDKRSVCVIGLAQHFVIVLCSDFIVQIDQSIQRLKLNSNKMLRFNPAADVIMKQRQIEKFPPLTDCLKCCCTHDRSGIGLWLRDAGLRLNRIRDVLCDHANVLITPSCKSATTR